jgi:hypothetical protein
MQHPTGGANSRGWIVRILIPVLVVAVCVLMAGGVWAQGERKQRKGSGESKESKESRARRDDSGGRTADRGKGSSSSASKRSGGSVGEKRTDGGGSSRDGSRGSDDRSSRERTDRERKPASRERYRRVRGREDGGREMGEKKKKRNPGSGKTIVKKGEESRIKIEPRPGRYPPPPDVEVETIDPWRPPPPLVPPMPPLRPHPVPGRYIDNEEYVIHLPAGIIEPDEVEPAFLESIEYIRSIGRGDSLLVCLYQTRRPMTDEEIGYLFDRGVTFYRFLSAYTAIIDVSVEDIFLLVMDMPNFRWIGRYRAEYKYRHEPPESNRRGAYVHSLVGDSEEFRNMLEHIGIEVVAYYEDTEDYYVIADWEQFHEIAVFWWVEKVYKEPESFSNTYGLD